MATETKPKSNTWMWVIICIFVAIVAVGVIYYIGWFDNNTHVDTPAGDDVEQTYTNTNSGADTPGEASWENADHQSLDQALTSPETPTQTPPSN